MDLNRRGLLIGLSGALLAPAVAHALIIPTGALADPKIGRYAMAVKLHRELVEANKNLYAFRRQYAVEKQIDEAPFGWVRNTPVAEMHDKFTGQADLMLEFLMDNFPAKWSPDARDQCRQLFEGTLFVDTFSEEGLMAIMDVLVPVAIIKYDIKVERMPFDTTRMPSFDRFAGMYKDLIFTSV